MNCKPINRASFLKASVPLLTVPMLTGACRSIPNRSAQLAAQTQELQSAGPNWANYPIVQAAMVGIGAPNPHNTQAWKLQILDARRMRLFVDADRLLPATDPTTRQIHIGQGTFLEMTAMAASQRGYTTSIRLFPEGQYGPDQVGKKPVAEVELKNTGAQPDPLGAYSAQRATVRTVYYGPNITEQELTQIHSLTDPRFCTIRWTAPAQLEATHALVYKAMEVEMQTYRTADESYRWLRLSDDDIYKNRDGISLRGGGLSGLTLWAARTFFVKADRKSYHDPDSINQYLDLFKAKVHSTKGYLFVETKTNNLTDWVNAGRDYMRLHLAVTKAGLVMHPVSQILQEYPEMSDLQKDFRKLHSVQAGAKIQMLVRLGRSDYRFYAPRRPIGAMVLGL